MESRKQNGKKIEWRRKYKENRMKRKVGKREWENREKTMEARKQNRKKIE